MRRSSPHRPRREARPNGVRATAASPTRTKVIAPALQSVSMRPRASAPDIPNEMAETSANRSPAVSRDAATSALSGVAPDAVSWVNVLMTHDITGG